jgi:3-dehydroquinate dehydratase
VIRDLCVARVAGKGRDGYREALTRLQEELSTAV